MEQLTTSKIVEQKNTSGKKKDRREGKGLVLALSRRIYRLIQTNVFYVESESTNNIYYFVKFKPDVIGSWYCSCPDNSTRHKKCKHLHPIEFAIRMGTLKDTDGGLPTEAKVKKKVTAPPAITTTTTVTKPTTKSYTEDDYSF